MNLDLLKNEFSLKLFHKEKIMIKKILISGLVVGIFWYDWKILGEILEDKANLESKYMILFGSVSFLAILLYLIDREH